VSHADNRVEISKPRSIREPGASIIVPHHCALAIQVVFEDSFCAGAFGSCRIRLQEA